LRRIVVLIAAVSTGSLERHFGGPFCRDGLPGARVGRSALTRRDSGPWLRRAWTAVALVSVFFFIGFAVGQGMYAMMGYKPENADAPVWVDVVALVPALVVVLIPCAAAVLFDRQANKGGDHRGVVPLVIGVIAGIGLLVLTIVSEVGDIVRR